MCRTDYHIIDRRSTYEVSLGGLLLVCGCAIYLLFRSRSLNIYQWCYALGWSKVIERLRIITQGWNVSDFIRYSLPDGLYCAAYILIVDAIWYNKYGPRKYAVILLVPTIAIGSELLQALNQIRGTFDVYDLVCYALPPLVYVCFITYHKFNNYKE